MPERTHLNSQEMLQIWKLAKAGDRNSLALLLKSFQDQIYRFCRSRLGQESLAVDATQETAVRLISKLDTFRGQGQLSTWILGIANNVCREFRRQNQKWQQASDLEVAGLQTQGLIPEELDRKDTKQQLQRMIGILPERQQEAIVLRFFEALSIEETAEVMGVKSGTVKATTSQALKNLKRQLRHVDKST